MTTEVVHNYRSDLYMSIEEIEAEMDKIDAEIAKSEKVTTEVNYRSGPCNTNEDRNEDGTLQNPTIQKEAQELTNQYGKKSIRTVTGTFWCDSEEIRKMEFERVKSVWPTARYILYGPLELTEENKKPHLHFIIAFPTPKMFKTIIKTLKSSEYHIENCRNYHSAVEYCLKSNPNDKLEYGEPLKQGLRTDIKKALEAANYNIKEVQKNNPELFVRYRSGIKDICETKNKENNVLDWLNLTEDENGNIKKKGV